MYIKLFVYKICPDITEFNLLMLALIIIS